MMRKVFGGAMVLSIVGAVVLGGILAFQTQQQTNEFTAKVGDATWVLAYEAEPNVIVPGYGNQVVGEGYLANDPGSAFSIVNKSGSVTISEVSSSCPISSFSSDVLVVNGDPIIPGGGFLIGTPAGAAAAVQGGDTSTLVSQSDEVAAGGLGEPSQATIGLYPGGFQARIGLPTNPISTCYGATIGYHVTINVTAEPFTPPA